MNANSRLRKLEHGNGGTFANVISWIRAERYCDELTDDERQEYKAYKESVGGVADDLAGGWLAVNLLGKTEAEAYHFPLTKRRRPPTPEEMAQTAREIEEFMNEKSKSIRRDER